MAEFSTLVSQWKAFCLGGSFIFYSPGGFAKGQTGSWTRSAWPLSPNDVWTCLNTLLWPFIQVRRGVLCFTVHMFGFLPYKLQCHISHIFIGVFLSTFHHGSFQMWIWWLFSLPRLQFSIIFLGNPSCLVWGPCRSKGSATEPFAGSGSTPHGLEPHWKMLQTIETRFLVQSLREQDRTGPQHHTTADKGETLGGLHALHWTAADLGVHPLQKFTLKFCELQFSQFTCHDKWDPQNSEAAAERFAEGQDMHLARPQHTTLGLLSRELRQVKSDPMDLETYLQRWEAQETMWILRRLKVWNLKSNYIHPKVLNMSIHQWMLELDRLIQDLLMISSFLEECVTSIIRALYKFVAVSGVECTLTPVAQAGLWAASDSILLVTFLENSSKLEPSRLHVRQRVVHDVEGIDIAPRWIATSVCRLSVADVATRLWAAFAYRVDYESDVLSWLFCEAPFLSLVSFKHVLSMF